MTSPILCRPRMQEPNYSGFPGSSPSPSPAYPTGSHVSSNPESQPFLPAPLYPPASKSVLSYMGASSPMSNSSLLTGQPPSPTWQSSSPGTASAVQEGQISADSHHSAYSRLTGFGNSMANSRETSNYFGMVSHLNQYAAYNMWQHTHSMATLQSYGARGIQFGRNILRFILMRSLTDECLRRAPDGRLLRRRPGVRQLRVHVHPAVEEGRDR